MLAEEFRFRYARLFPDEMALIDADPEAVQIGAL
jgi:hypothetical protein